MMMRARIRIGSSRIVTIDDKSEKRDRRGHHQG